MRVLHVFNEIKYSGAEIMYANAAPYFQQEGIQMFALATGRVIGDFELEFVKNNIKIIHKPFSSILSFGSYIKEIRSLIRKNKIEIIHIHRSDVKWLFALIAKLEGVKCVYTVHNVFKHRKLTWIKGYLERYTARKWFGLQFQTIGQSVYDNELNYYKTPSVRINNWFDSNRFYPAVSTKEKSNCRVELGISNSTYILISTGGCSWVKNHHDILKAIPLLKEKDIMYLHLGCGKTETEEKDLVRELNIEDKVRFLGNQNNVRDYLVVSDIYLMPSRFEGLSIASIEAMATGVSSVLYDSPGLRDLIKDNDNGLLIEHDHVKLAESIDWMIENNEKAKLLAKNAVKFVNKEFDIQKNVKNIIELYKI